MHKHIQRLLLICVFAFLAVSVRAAKQPTYNILFVQSYTEYDAWSKEQIEGLTKGFKDNSISVNITTEYLNSRYWDANGEEELMRKYCDEAAERNTQLIVVSNDEALFSLLNCGHTLPSQIPVVFFGVEFPNKELMSKYEHLTGMTAPHAYDVLFKTAKSIFPDRIHTVMISEDTDLGGWSSEIFHKSWNEFAQTHSEYNLKTFDVTNDPFPEILESIQISAQAQKSVMVIPYWGLYMNSIAKASKAPTFTLSASALGNGVFCTVAPNMFGDGEKAATLASRILKGEKAASIPITESEYELAFDYTQLVFFKIKKDQLPKNSVLIKEPYIEKYGVLFFLFYASIIALLVFVVVRLIAMNRRESRRRMHVQTKLLIQNRLVAQRNEFDHIFHSIRDAVITYDADYRIHFINKATLEMLNRETNAVNAGLRVYEGQSAGALLGLYKDGENILMPLLKKVTQEGLSLELPENCFVKDVDSETFFPVSGEVVPLYAQGKQNGLVLTFRNISDVALQKRFFTLAVEESSIYPWQYNQESEMFTFPVAYMNHMGFLGRTLLGRREMDKFIHPEDWQDAKSTFEAIMFGQSTATRLNFRQRNNTGNYEWWEFRISVVKGLTGEPYNILGVCQSIQRYKTTEEELIAARDRALQADKLKSAFLANMSHEIRTPLNAIVGFSDLLKDYQAFEDEDIQQFIATINKNCELLLALISDILDLSRVESGTMDFQFAPYYMPVIMQEIYDSQRLNMPMGVQLVKDVPEGSDRTIITDSVRLKQVINNLINNAVKFTTKGSITFGYSEDETDYTTFFVEDTGTGISKEDVERIFERFYKVDSFTQGAGLGLSISQTIVSRLKGKIGVTSTLGKGTRFTVRIPNTVD
ncbi:PAS domain S-box protein [Bacteroides sp. OttesenSCG-928-J23]|nr:PAS domain S-box protein [Bacteroides sp. OttesenSCG-928-J23]MDL2305672.1 PAS domain S-box protein [Bacteroides sp. OttesenSCG-928-D19]